MEAADMKVPQSQSETCECDIHVGQTVTCRMMQFYKKKKKKKKKKKLHVSLRSIAVQPGQIWQLDLSIHQVLINSH